MANLYGFGRLAWNPNLNVRSVAAEWTRLTFGNDPVVVRTITDMQMASWHIYESYTGSLGTQTLTDILGSHYGPGVESSERNGWGQWHRADHEGIGMDRTVTTGTGYTGQYRAPVAERFEYLRTTPDELILFFHHVPYTFVLHSGKTVIQHIYDSHYEGAELAADYVRQWESIKGRVDEERYADVLARLEYQAGHAIVWRDAVCSWFLRASGIPDTKGRVGHHPDRVEAEAMQLQGYLPVDVAPWENASGGKGIECTEPQGCVASFQFAKKPGWYNIDVQYFDLNNGESTFRVSVGSQLVDEWVAKDHLPSARLGGDSSTRRRITGLPLRPGDQIRIEGIPNGGERAPLDYIEITPIKVSVAGRTAKIPLLP
jgi:alpha-glucuronidase